MWRRELVKSENILFFVIRRFLTSYRVGILVEGSRMACDWPESQCKMTFKGMYELDRHKRTQHERTTSYACPVLGCHRDTSHPFFRNDKLKTHVIKMHSEEDSFACPVAACGFILPPDILSIHISKHGVQEISESRAAFSVVSWLWPHTNRPGSGRHWRKCPLSDCEITSPSPHELLRHLARHNQQQRLSEECALFAAGYNAATLGVICPICRLEVPSHDEFKSHMERTHLVTDATHFQAWGEYFEKRGGYCNASVIPSSRSWSIVLAKSTRLACPACDFEMTIEPVKPLKRYWVSHHLRCLVSLETLRPYRRDIIKLWPEFEEHAVFDDIVPGGVDPVEC